MMSLLFKTYTSTMRDFWLLPLWGSFVGSSIRNICLRYGTVVACTIWNENCLHYVGFWSLQLVAVVGYLCYVKPIPFPQLLQLDTFAIRDFGYRHFMKDLSCICCIRPWSPLLSQLVALVTWDFCHLSWLSPFREQYDSSPLRDCGHLRYETFRLLLLSGTYLLYNIASAMFISFKQV